MATCFERSRIARVAVPALLLALAAVPALAQSVQPNRYGTQPQPRLSTDTPYQRQQQATEDARRQQQDAVRRGEQDRIGVAIDANRRRLEADRARTERQRAAASSPAESERLRQDYEMRRQAYEREREELERQRAQAPQAAKPSR